MRYSVFACMVCFQSGNKCVLGNRRVIGESQCRLPGNQQCDKHAFHTYAVGQIHEKEYPCRRLAKYKVYSRHG